MRSERSEVKAEMLVVFQFDSYHLSEALILIIPEKILKKHPQGVKSFSSASAECSNKNNTAPPV